MPDPSDAPVPEAGPMPRSLVLLLAVACALSVANVYYAQPLLDAIGREFGLAEGAVGIVVTATQLGCALALLFVVPLGDLLDRRRLMIGQLALLVLALAAVALAANTPWLLIGMVALGLLGTAMTQGLLALSAALARLREMTVTSAPIATAILTPMWPNPPRPTTATRWPGWTFHRRSGE